MPRRQSSAATISKREGPVAVGAPLAQPRQFGVQQLGLLGQTVLALLKAALNGLEFLPRGLGLLLKLVTSLQGLVAGLNAALAAGWGANWLTGWALW